MEIVKTSKSKMEETSESNLGHTSDEWGTEKKKSPTRTFVAYTVSWND